MSDSSDVPYTRLPRSTLWLVRGDDVTVGGDGADEQPRFEAQVRSFYISKTPITNEEYEVYDPGHARGPTSPDDDSPAVSVSFVDAVGYCRWYSERSGKAFRLPTEVEWEYACRGETTTRFPWGDDPAQADGHAWDAAAAAAAAVSSAGAPSGTAARCHRVEQLRSNPFGLYDMLGNVWEWTGSLYRPYPAEPGDGRDDVAAGGDRVVRGGSFRSERGAVGSATRRALAPDAAPDDVGFRILRLL